MEKTVRENMLGAAVLESVKVVQDLGYTVLYAANYGSHNYNLDIYNEEYNSDIDTKVIILPTLEELVRNSKPVSTTIEISTGQCDIKDIRAFVQTLLKANIQFLEVLKAESYWINFDYIEDFKWFIDNLDELIKGNKPQLLKSIYGMSLEKKKALCHPYPTIKWKIDKYGYDGKQLHHIMRLKNFIDRYFYGSENFENAIRFKNDTLEKEQLIEAKLNHYPLKAAQDFAEMYCNIIEKDTRKLVDSLGQNNEIKEEYLKKSQEIIIKNIKNKILEENK